MDLSLVIGKVIRALGSGARRATVYTRPDLTVKATRQRRPSRRDRAETFLVTVGRPNHRERLFIKACQRAGEPFPVKKVQLQFFPKRKRHACL